MSFRSNEPSHDAEQLYIDRYNKHTEAGFTSVYLYLHPDIFAFISSILRGSPASEEIANDCFLKTWALKKRFKDMAELKGYHTNAAKNACLNYLESPAGRTIYKELADEDHVTNPSDALHNKLLIQLIMEEIRKTSEKKSDLFRKMLLEDTSAAEYSSENDIAENVVRSKKSKLLKQIQQQYKGKK